MFTDILSGAALGAGYIALVLLLLGANHYVIDVLTPGHLWTRTIGGDGEARREVEALLERFKTGANEYTMTAQQRDQIEDARRSADRTAPSLSAGIVVAAAWLGQGYLAYTTIINTEAGVDGAIIGILVFGVLTILVHAVVLVGLNLLSGGMLNRVITAPGFNPAAIAVAGALLAVSIGASAAITP